MCWSLLDPVRMCTNQGPLQNHLLTRMSHSIIFTGNRTLPALSHLYCVGHICLPILQLDGQAKVADLGHTAAASSTRAAEQDIPAGIQRTTSTFQMYPTRPYPCKGPPTHYIPMNN